MLLAALLALSQPPVSPDWIEFDLRQRGWTQTPARYDALSLERRGDRIRVWIAHGIALSGLPDRHHLERVELDCRTGRSRVLEGRLEQGSFPVRRYGATDFAAIAPGTTEAALAALVCAGPGGAAAGPDSP